MTQGEITAAFDSVAESITLLTSLFGGNITVIFAVIAVLAVWGLLAHIVRKLTSVVRV